MGDLLTVHCQLRWLSYLYIQIEIQMQMQKKISFVGQSTNSSLPVGMAAKAKLEEKGFVAFTEFLDKAEMEEVEENLAR